MPVSPMIFLYAVSILAGAVLVACGLSQGRDKKAASPDSRGRCGANDLPVEILDAVPLRFMDEETALEDPLPGVSRRKRRRLASMAAAGTGSTGKTAVGISQVLTAPFRRLARLAHRRGGEAPDRPVTFKIHLDARGSNEAGAINEEAGVPVDPK